jgi:transposase-like protein
MDGPSVPLRRTDRQEAFWTLVDQQAGQLTGRILQQVLLDQQQDILKAQWNQRPPDRRGWRNGYYPRRLLTRQGPVAIKVPRCRNGPMDLGLLFDRYQRRIPDVDRVLRHAVLLGHSTRDTARLAEQIFGGSLSHQAVSRLMRWLDQQLRDWRQRPILPVYKLVYIDGMYVSVRGAGKRTVMIVAGRRDDGGLDVLDFCVSSGESCRHLLANLRRRGLEGVELFVSDESGAIRSALEKRLPPNPLATLHLPSTGRPAGTNRPDALPKRHGQTGRTPVPLPVKTGRQRPGHRLGQPLASP